MYKLNFKNNYIPSALYPTFEEAEEFIKEDLKRFGYDGVYGITPLTEQELHSFFDTESIDEWKVLSN